MLRINMSLQSLVAFQNYFDCYLFLRPFLSLFSFWDPYTVDVGAFNIAPRVLWDWLHFFSFLSLNYFERWENPLVLSMPVFLEQSTLVVGTSSATWMALTKHAGLKVTSDLLIALILSDDVSTASDSITWHLTQEGDPAILPFLATPPYFFSATPLNLFSFISSI